MKYLVTYAPMSNLTAQVVEGVEANSPEEAVASLGNKVRELISVVESNN